MDNEFSLPIFGTRLTVLGMALGGSLLSFAYGKPERNRSKLFKQALANTFLGAVAVVIIPAWLGWDWVTPIIEGPLAGALAFSARFAVPLFIEIAPDWLRARFVSPQNAASPAVNKEESEGDTP